MKKLLLVWIALILFSAVPACAEDDASDLQIDLDVGAIRFTVPDGFRITSNTADDLIMENDDYATLKVRMCDSAGYTLEECIEHIDEYIYYDDIELRYKGPVNNCELFSLDYRYNYSGLDIFGNYIGILDDSDNTLYLFHYYATRALNLTDENAIDNLMFSIQFIKSPEQTPTPTPTLILFPTPISTPTPAPTTSEYFDYDAIIANPDTYKGFYYSLVCDIARIDEVDMNAFNWTHPVMALVSVDGNIGKVAYVVFDNPDEAIKNGDTVHMSVEFVNVTDMQTALGFYVKMPMFLAYRIEAISK